MRQIAQFVAAVGLLVIASDACLGQNARLASWRLEREIRFGDETNLSSQLERPYAMAVGPGGRIVVFDQKAGTLKEYETTGRYLRSFGRKGQGPGEFTTVSIIGFLGDSVWFADPAAMRLTLVTPDRRTFQTYPSRFEPTSTSLSPRTARAMLMGGLMVAQGEVRNPRGRAGNMPKSTEISSPIVLVPRDGGIADTMATPVVPVQPAMSIAVGSAYSIETQPFDATPLWRGRPDGLGVILLEQPIASSDADAYYTITVFDAKGKRVSSRKYRYAPVPVTPAVVDEYLAGRFDKTPPAFAAKKGEFRDQVLVPKYLPAVGQIMVGRDGSIWLQRGPTAMNGRVWEVISPAGEQVGRVEVPEVLDVRNGYADMTSVIGIEKDSDGIPWMVRYRVRP